jgi:hypothetical protein
MRITLHVVHVDDHPAMHAAMQPTLRAARLNDPRFKASGLSADDTHALVPDLMGFAARPRSAAEVEAWIGARLGVPLKGVWWALRQFGPCYTPPAAGRGRFVLLAYADRSRVTPPDYRKLVARSNGDVLSTLLVDGYVAGV